MGRMVWREKFGTGKWLGMLLGGRGICLRSEGDFFKNLEY